VESLVERRAVDFLFRQQQVGCPDDPLHDLRSDQQALGSLAELGEPTNALTGIAGAELSKQIENTSVIPILKPEEPIRVEQFRDDVTGESGDGPGLEPCATRPAVLRSRIWVSPVAHMAPRVGDDPVTGARTNGSLGDLHPNPDGDNSVCRLVERSQLSLGKSSV